MKSSPMPDEVCGMIDLRHSAEQRGDFEPLGRLVTMITEHGPIEFPCEHGVGTGPDLALTFATRKEENCTIHSDALILLGTWSGLPPLWERTSIPCPRCQHACDVCDGSGKKLCEGLDCGGRGWISGNWISCPGSGCHAETGKFNPNCEVCANSPIRGQIAERVTCKMCEGSGQMTCSRCRGTGKFSTGMIRGSLDYQLPRCKFCRGTGWKGKANPQKIEQFSNALLDKFSVLGPIYNFTVIPFGQGRGGFKIFDVTPDDKNDMLVLLVPRDKRVRPQKAYLLGGVVRERVERVA